MRKIFIALGILGTIFSAPAHISTSGHVEQAVPAYAKWGKLAIKETSFKYPNATIIDYLHEGSESSGDSTIEKFKLWLKDGDREFGVSVRIEFTTETENVLNIDIQEV